MDSEQTGSSERVICINGAWEFPFHSSYCHLHVEKENKSGKKKGKLKGEAKRGLAAG